MVDRFVHESNSPMIEMLRVHRFFGKTRAVNDISFEVYRGQVFGFIGPNGAGKSRNLMIDRMPDDNLKKLTIGNAS